MTEQTQTKQPTWMKVPTTPRLCGVYHDVGDLSPAWVTCELVKGHRGAHCVEVVIGSSVQLVRWAQDTIAPPAQDAAAAERDEGWRDEPSPGAAFDNAAREITRLRGVLRGVQVSCESDARIYRECAIKWIESEREAKGSGGRYETGFWRASHVDATKRADMADGIAARIAAALAEGTDDDA
jgi:hypothetical protein